MENDNKIEINKNGQQVMCDIYYSFVSEDTNKGYIVFTDHELDENNKTKLYVKSCDPNDPSQELSDLTPAEYEMASKVMNKIQSQL